MIGLVWFLQLGSDRWWSGSSEQDVSAFGDDCMPGLEPGRFPSSVENPLTRLSLQLKPDTLGIFEADPGALAAEVAWGYGASALGGTVTLLSSRFYGRLDRCSVDALNGVVDVELEHHLAFTYRAPRRVWSHKAQQAEYSGDEGLSQLPGLARGDVTGRWPPN